MKNFMKYNFTVTDVVISGYVEPGTGKKTHTNRQSHGLSFNLGEKKEYIFDNGNIVTLGQNEIIYLPKGSSYKVKTALSGKCYFINFEINEPAVFNPFSFKPRNPTRYMTEFENANKLHEGKKISYEMQQKATLYRVLSLMQIEYASKYLSSKTAKIIAPAIEYIHENYRQTDIKIALLADMCSISEDYLRKIFKSVYGLSPVKYINQLKINYAKELILSGMYSINESAQLSGFNDISYFCREFRKYFELSPSDYKRQS